MAKTAKTALNKKASSRVEKRHDGELLVPCLYINRRKSSGIEKRIVAVFHKTNKLLHLDGKSENADSEPTDWNSI